MALNITTRLLSHWRVLAARAEKAAQEAEKKLAADKAAVEKMAADKTAAEKKAAEGT